jgi:hypothetical protein
MNLQYDLYHNTYIPAKTEGIIVIQEARRMKQVEVVALYFLTYKSSPSGRLPIKAHDVFKKVYSLPPSHPKKLVEEIVCNLSDVRAPNGFLKALTVMSETVYNVFGRTKIVHIAFVSSCMYFFLYIFCMTILQPHVRRIAHLLLHGNLTDARPQITLLHV